MKARRFLAILALAFTALVVTAPLASAQDAAAKAPEVKKSKSLWDKIVLGGFIMIPLAGFSVAMVWLVIDGTQRSSLKRLMPESEVEKARNFFRAGDYVASYQACTDNPCAFNNILRAGLINIGDGKEATEDGLIGETVLPIRGGNFHRSLHGAPRRGHRSRDRQPDRPLGSGILAGSPRR